LRHADDDDIFLTGEAPPVLCHDVILALLRFEGDQRDAVMLGETLDGADEPIVERFEQRRRWNRMAEVFLQEETETPRGLQLRHPRVQVQAINTADLERHVLADNGSDVGRHRTLLGGKSDDGTPPGEHRVTGPNILSSAISPRNGHLSV
jgi:hypothetical protein